MTEPQASVTLKNPSRRCSESGRESAQPRARTLTCGLPFLSDDCLFCKGLGMVVL
ncbi:rCG51608 [Rattus norvegicus]|uniref:RCG51608 n=1 Tax=Rattus norvegicus TaxID=10116 RepID=A6IZ26_RAT|nr:rCG51608 [Rattus norvegicus]